jgi:ferritin-like metal-binding protein YciE
MTKTATMDDLYVTELRDLYDAEKQLTRALPKMAKASSSDELRQAFENHLEQTQGHVKRLEQIFEGLGQKGTGRKCDAMAGLVKEGEDVVSETDASVLRDAGLIGAAQKVEHYEIAGYGTVRAHAEMLGYSDAVSLLEQTLAEEKETDQKLNDLAESTINVDATEEGAGSTESRSRHNASPRTRTAGGS